MISDCTIGLSAWNDWGKYFSRRLLAAHNGDGESFTSCKNQYVQECTRTPALCALARDSVVDSCISCKIKTDSRFFRWWTEQCPYGELPLKEMKNLIDSLNDYNRVRSPIDFTSLRASNIHRSKMVRLSSIKNTVLNCNKVEVKRTYMLTVCSCANGSASSLCTLLYEFSGCF